MEARKENCFKFFIYACIFGILIPTFLLIVYDIVVPTFQQGLVKLYLLALMAIVFYPLIAYTLYDKNILSANTIDSTLRLTGAITIILVGISVHYTGGMEKSMMSSYFFFVPSAIAIAYDANKSLKIVIPLALIAVSINLLIKTDSKPFENSIYLGFYIFGIAMQFYAIYKLETTKKKIS